MWFEQFIRPETGCATYIVGSSQTNECLVFDPLWDIKPYCDKANSRGSQIKYVVDSHSHADHVSGARRLTMACSGAELILPTGALVNYPARFVKDGDTIRFGEISIRIIHVPGHRPEQINLLVFDYSRGDEPWCMLTADFLLVGDIARPDLGQEGIEGAAMLFDKALSKLHSLPDFVEIYPGHVAGST